SSPASPPPGSGESSTAHFDGLAPAHLADWRRSESVARHPLSSGLLGGQHATPGGTSAPALARRYAPPVARPPARRPGVQPGPPHRDYARRSRAGGAAFDRG